VTRLGDNRQRPVDVRVLAATNADLHQRSRTAASARTCTSACAWSPSSCRRCTSARATSSCWPSTSCSTSPNCTARMSRASTARRWSDWCSTTGRATCANCATRSSRWWCGRRGNILTRADLPPEIWAPTPLDSDAWQFLAGRNWQEVEKKPHPRVVGTDGRQPAESGQVDGASASGRCTASSRSTGSTDGGGGGRCCRGRVPWTPTPWSPRQIGARFQYPVARMSGHGLLRSSVVLAVASVAAVRCCCWRRCWRRRSGRRTTTCRRAGKRRTRRRTSNCCCRRRTSC